jgi:hypothetical protein
MANRWRRADWFRISHTDELIEAGSDSVAEGCPFAARLEFPVVGLGASVVAEGDGRAFACSREGPGGPVMCDEVFASEPVVIDALREEGVLFCASAEEAHRVKRAVGPFVLDDELLA